MRHLGIGSWYCADAHVAGVSLGYADRIARYGDGVVVVASSATNVARAKAAFAELHETPGLHAARARRKARRR